MSSDGPPTILLTGASGFIGAAVAARLAPAGPSVRCLVRPSSDTRALSALATGTAGRLCLVPGELTDRDSLAAAVDGVDVVIHCAALVSDWGTVAEIRAANTVAAADLGLLAARAGARRFIQISSTDVYGHPGTPKVAEDQVASGFANWYAETKREAEGLLEQIAVNTGMELVRLRPATVYGPGSIAVVGEMARALRGGYLPLISGGRAVAGLVHIDNVVDAVLMVLDRAAAAGQAYNVSDELDITWARFLSDLADGLGVSPPRLSLPEPLARGAATLLEEGYRALRRRTGLTLAPLLSRQALQVLAVDQDFSSAKLRGELGWRPRISYPAGLADTLAWLTQDDLAAG